MPFPRTDFAPLLFVVALAAIACAKDPVYGTARTGGASGTGGAVGTGGAAGTGAGALGNSAEALAAAGLPASFAWTSTGPLLAPMPDATHPIVSVKDPSVVFFEGRWHVFATTANTSGNWSVIYLSFADWTDAASAQPYYLDNNPPNLRGYHAAPQVFYFAPQAKWYLIFQSGQPQYSTTDDITKPESWSQPINFFPAEPPGVIANKGAGFWLDFFVICDDVHCHLFFTDDDGEVFRSQTDIGTFPMGFGDATVAIQGTKETLFEGGSTYRLKGRDAYLTLIEAFGPTGNRFYRSFVSQTLDGSWTPLAASWNVSFAGKLNVTFDSGTAWTNDISHGEMIRAGYDQNLEIDPTNLQFLYQGVDPTKTSVAYSQIPYTLGLLTQQP